MKKRLRRSENTRRKRVTIRLETELLALLRREAARRKEGYQTMVRRWLWEKVQRKPPRVG